MWAVKKIFHNTDVNHSNYKNIRESLNLNFHLHNKTGQF